MKTCSECSAKAVYRCTETVDATILSGELLPKLGAGMFSGASLYPAVCAECGAIRFYASADAIEKMKNSEQWHQI